MNVRLSDEAEADLRGYLSHVARENPLAALRVSHALAVLLDDLALGHFDGPVARLKTGEEVRHWPMNPLSIFYQRHADELLVVRIYHQARRSITRSRRRR